MKTVAGFCFSHPRLAGAHRYTLRKRRVLCALPGASPDGRLQRACLQNDAGNRGTYSSPTPEVHRLPLRARFVRIRRGDSVSYRTGAAVFPAILHAPSSFRKACVP